MSLTRSILHVIYAYLNSINVCDSSEIKLADPNGALQNIFIFSEPLLTSHIFMGPFQSCFFLMIEVKWWSCIATDKNIRKENFVMHGACNITFFPRTLFMWTYFLFFFFSLCKGDNYEYYHLNYKSFVWIWAQRRYYFYMTWTYKFSSLLHSLLDMPSIAYLPNNWQVHRYCI